MKKLGKARGGLVMSIGLVLAACGGGGSSTGSGTQLTALQQTAQDQFSATNGGSYTLSTYLPPTSGMPQPGVHYAFGTQYIVSSQLSVAPQRFTETLGQISPTLPQPNFANWYPARVLVNGAIMAMGTPDTLIERVRLDGDTIASDTLATDGTTVLTTLRYVSLQALPLSGRFVDAPPEVRTWPALAAFSTNTSLLKANPTFVSGATYHKRQATRVGDVLYIMDCSGATHGVNPTPCGTSTTVESVFPHVYGGATYNLADGTVQTLQGLRAWVSNAPVAPTVNPTSVQLLFVERAGVVYRGQLQRDGTVLRARLADGTLVDYSLRFNQQAIDSLKAAVAF